MPRSFAALSAAYHRDKLDWRAPLISFTFRKIFPNCARPLSRVYSLRALLPQAYLNPRDKQKLTVNAIREDCKLIQFSDYSEVGLNFYSPAYNHRLIVRDVLKTRRIKLNKRENILCVIRYLTALSALITGGFV